MQPTVTESLGSALWILPVAGHHILAAHDDLTLGAERNLLAVVVADLDVKRLHDTARRAEHRMAGRVGGDDRGRLGHAVALEHRNADGAEISLKLDVQKRAASHKELHPAAESLTDLLEYDLVEQGHQRLLPKLKDAATVVIFLVVGDCEVEGVVVEFLDLRSLLVDGGLNVFLEVAGKRRH